mgnify:CR=1 FL=1
MRRFNFREKFDKYFLTLKRKLRGKFYFYSALLPEKNSQIDILSEKVSNCVNKGISISENIINLNSIKEKNNFFPLLEGENFLENSFYKSLNKEVSGLLEDTKLIKEKQNEVGRSNLLVDKRYGTDNLRELRRRNSPLYLLYKSLDSFEFRSFLYKKFNKYLLENGLTTSPINSFIKSDLYCMYCEGTKDYENYIHTDRRSIVVQGLMYFGSQDFKGGEFSIYKHKKLNITDYKGTPDYDDILESRAIEASNNKAVFFLNTPNSYHKGKCSGGLRRFLCWSFALPKSCWINTKNYGEISYKKVVG